MAECMKSMKLVCLWPNTSLRGGRSERDAAPSDFLIIQIDDANNKAEMLRTTKIGSRDRRVPLFPFVVDAAGVVAMFILFIMFAAVVPPDIIMLFDAFVPPIIILFDAVEVAPPPIIMLFAAVVVVCVMQTGKRKASTTRSNRVHIWLVCNSKISNYINVSGQYF